MERTSSKKTSSKSNVKGDVGGSAPGGTKGDKGDKGRQSKADIIAKYKGQFNEELSAMLYTHGDPKDLAPDPVTLDLLDDILLEFLYDTAHHAHRYAPAKSRIKVDDLRVAFRHDPILLGRLEEIIEKEKKIERARKSANPSTDASSLALLAEEFGTFAESGGGGLMGSTGDDDEEQLNRLLGSFQGDGFGGSGSGLDALLGSGGARQLSGLGKEDEEVDLSETSTGVKQRKRKSVAGETGQGAQSKKPRIGSPQKKSIGTSSGSKPEVFASIAGNAVADNEGDDCEDGDGDMDEVTAKETTPVPLDPVLAAILGGF